MTFAAQGAIAIRNASLMQAARTRGRASSGGRSISWNGLSKVGETVSSSLEIRRRCWLSIVKHAVELSGTEGGSIFEFDDESKEFQDPSHAYGTGQELLQRDPVDQSWPPRHARRAGRR